MKLDHLRNVIAQSVLCGLLSMVITIPLGIACIATLPGPEEDASTETQESYRKWKRSMRFPVAIVCIALIPGILAAARFASTYPASPLPFWTCVLVTAFVAGIAHISTMPVKGDANYTVILVATAAAASVLTLFGTSVLNRDADDDTNANHAMDRSRG